MKKLFLDADVFLDLLLDREPFVDDITEIIEISATSNTQLCISPISVTNIHYIIGRLENKTKADTQIKKLLQLVKVESVGQTAVNKAANSKFKDFEDAVQNFCAKEAGHQIIVTRNVKDYKASDLSTLTPKEYLASIQNI